MSYTTHTSIDDMIDDEMDSKGTRSWKKPFEIEDLPRKHVKEAQRINKIVSDFIAQLKQTQKDCSHSELKFIKVYSESGCPRGDASTYGFYQCVECKRMELKSKFRKIAEK